MAMLAEPRRKTKYQLQPYTSLSKINKRVDGDTNSFGYKLMASMGWAPGKGLGAGETGEVDPIKLRLKNDAAGMGFKISEHDALSQQSEFQALLQQLNSAGLSGGDSSIKPSKKSRKAGIKSLEQRSEQSSRRVHYKKFTRGKDLSRASEKDLRSILGMTSSEASSKEVEAEPERTVPMAEGAQSEMYITAGSSVDYFKGKFAEIKNKKEDKVSEKDDSAEVDTSCLNDTGNVKKRRSVTWGDVDISYVDNYIQDILDTSGSLEESCVEEPSIKKKKKKKRKGQFVTESPHISVEQIEVLTQMSEGKKKKRKKDTSEESFKENTSDVQDADISAPKIKKKRKTKSLQEEETVIIKNAEAPCNIAEILGTNIESPVKLKKKKKNQDVKES